MVWVPRKTRGFAFGFITDSHQDDTSNIAHVLTALNWLKARPFKPKAIIHSGDMNESPNHTIGFKEWLEAQTGWPDSDITMLPTIGNHDTEIAWLGGYGITPDDPHATCKSRYPSLFGGKEYYYWDYESVRIIVFNNLTDYLSVTSGNNVYPNCNPPGAQTDPNPDYSGITVPGSTQRNWLDSVTASEHLWKIGSCHRAFWTPFDSDPRKMNKLGRPAMVTPVNNGLDFLAQGDIHVGSLSGPWYPESPNYETKVEPGEVGCYSMSLAGGYAVRAVDVSTLPGYTLGDVTLASSNPNVHWAEGGATGSGITHAAWMVIEGDNAHLEIFSCSDAVPAGAVVHTQTLVRNPGA